MVEWRIPDGQMFLLLGLFIFCFFGEGGQRLFPLNHVFLTCSVTDPLRGHSCSNEFFYFKFTASN